MVNFIQHFIRYSPNHNERPALPTDFIVLHYTGMSSANAALERLCDAASGVSSHYLIDEQGEVMLLVEEDRRAWHAGVSHWKGYDNINDISIGIEIANGGHEEGYPPFHKQQMQSVLVLCQDILRRHELPASAVIGHSDVAPERKQDPGQAFPWQWLATHGVGIWHGVDDTELPQPCQLSTEDLRGLRKLGYAVSEDTSQHIYVVTAFQRHFCPSHINGQWNHTCRLMLERLLAQV